MLYTSQLGLTLQFENLGKDSDLAEVAVKLGFQSNTTFIISLEHYQKPIYKYYCMFAQSLSHV